MPFTLVHEDITQIKVDAIGYITNTKMHMDDAIGRAIFTAVGTSALQASCSKLAPPQPEKAVITRGFRLPARFIIHTISPNCSDAKGDAAELLRVCYLNSLQCAVEHQCNSVAFAFMADGIDGCSAVTALRVATTAISDFLTEYDLSVFLAVPDKAAFTVSHIVLDPIERYLVEHYIATDPHALHEQNLALEYEPLHYSPVEQATGLEFVISHLDEPFSATLLRLIDAKSLSDVEVYKRANLDRRLFSKIRSTKRYTPSKRTAVALAVALELTLEETEDLLERAGYALSRSQKFDVIVKYFIANGKYDIFAINEVLFQYDQPLLGG